jgi:hypothetical protein
MNETQFPEFIHEKINSGARCADHFRQRFLRHFGEHSMGLVVFAVAGKQKKSAREPFLARVKKLIHQIFQAGAVLAVYVARCQKSRIGSEKVLSWKLKVRHRR